jgi:FixJ family two-component response regulator
MTVGSVVYIIDDDLSARSGLARLLRAAGYDVHPFESAGAFLDSLGTESTGCVVSDARMPGISGEDLHVELSKLPNALPLIIVTGDDDPETKRRAQEMHAAGFFRKPVDGNALLDAIEWALKSNEIADELE